MTILIVTGLLAAGAAARTAIMLWRWRAAGYPDPVEDRANPPSTVERRLGYLEGHEESAC